MAWTVERHLAGQQAFAVDPYRRFIAAVETIGPFTYAARTTIIRKANAAGSNALTVVAALEPT